MATPGRRTRSRQTSREPEATGRASAVPSLPPARAESEVRHVSPRRSARNTPAKQTPAARPGLEARTSTAYGTVGRMDMPAALKGDRSAAQLLQEIREASDEGDQEEEWQPYDDDDDAEEQSDEDRQEEEEHKPIVQPSGSHQSRQPSATPSAPQSKAARKRPIRPVETLAPLFAPFEGARAEAITRPAEVAQTAKAAFKRALTPSFRAPSEHGTTIMENSANYAPVANVAEETLPLPPEMKQPSFVTTVRERLSDAYHHRPALYRIRLVFSRERVWPWLIILLPLLGPLFWALISDANFAGQPSNYQLYEPIGTLKNVSSAVWTSLTSIGQSSNGSDSGYGSALHRQFLSMTRQQQNSDSRIELLEKSQQLQTDTVANLKAMLPDQLILHKDNGDWHIPPSFFEAVQEHIKANATGEPQPPSWDIFLRKNEGELKRFVHDVFSEHADAVSADGTRRIVSAADVISILDSHLATVTTSMRTEIDAQWAAFESRAAEQRASTPYLSEQRVTEIAGDLVYDYIRAVTNRELHTLITSVLVQNTELNHKTVNFFSVALGALVNPFLTSTTHQRPRPLTHRIYARLARKPISNPSIMALTRWDEVGDCWCAAPPAQPRLPYGTTPLDLYKLKANAARQSAALLNAEARSSNRMSGHSPDHDLAPGQWGAKAQLAVLMPFTIYPRRLTIEHMPSTSVLDIGSAPRKVEVWAEILNATARALVLAEAAAIFRDEHPSASLAGDGVALQTEYVRIGWVQYDIRWPNHVQTGSLQVDLEALGVGVNMVVLRAVSNWGRDFTCFYRVRMHGKVVEAQRNRDWVQDVRVTEDSWQHKTWPW